MTCPNCFSEDVINNLCRTCHYDLSKAVRAEKALPLFTILNGKYQVGRVLGHGGFGITYIAQDLVNHRIVAIKECVPELFAKRQAEILLPLSGHEEHCKSCMTCFREESQVLKSLSSIHGVVHYIDSFHENRTEYLVMEFINGATLKYLTAKRKRMSVGNGLYILFLVGSTLLEVHRCGVLHRDISPENIMIASDGTVRLIDFGASKSFLSSHKEIASFLKPGFAPPEQYSLKERQGPWTDIYALGATFYTMVSGQPLIDSNTRRERDSMKSLFDLECGVPFQLSEVIKKSMALNVKERYTSIPDFLRDVYDFSALAESFDSELMSFVNYFRFSSQKRTVGEPAASSGITNAYVEVLSGSQAKTKKRIPDFGFVSIGKDYSVVDLALTDSNYISRKHCLVGFDRIKERFIVIDRSSNGTFYSNGMRMMKDAESFINPNDTFLIVSDKYRMRVVVE